jgi:hypothetical protein
MPVILDLRFAGFSKCAKEISKEVQAHLLSFQQHFRPVVENISTVSKF